MEFNKRFSMDIDAGGALFGLFGFSLVLSTGLYHTFNGGTMFGLRLTDYTHGLAHLLRLGVDLAFSIAN